jgi:hypothetical protein
MNCCASSESRRRASAVAASKQARVSPDKGCSEIQNVKLREIKGFVRFPEFDVRTI